MTSVMNEREIGRSSPGNGSLLGTDRGPSAGDEMAASEAEGSGAASGEFWVLADFDGRVSVRHEVEGSSRSSGDDEMEEVTFSSAGDGDAIPSCSDLDIRFPLAGLQQIRDFDEDTASYEVAVSDGVRVPHGSMVRFDLGDMVWGKVKSHPWWPGHIFDETFAVPSVRRARRDGHFLVAFFGDSSYGWFHPRELVPFAPHFAENSKQTTMKNFVRAVDEAVDETSRREALGLTCYCRNKSNFRPARVPGYFHVDVPGFEPGGIYSLKQIDDARGRFVPKDVLTFVQQTALKPTRSEFPSLDRIRSLAVLLAYRRAVFEEFDETYVQAFGVEPVRPSPNSGGIPDQVERFAPRATPLSGKLVIPESLSPRKVSATKHITASVPKVPSSKKNKYVLKRRDETQGGDPAATANSSHLSLPDLISSYPSYHNFIPTQQLHLQQQQNDQSVVTGDALPPAKVIPASSQLDQYVLQKRPLPIPGAEERERVWEGSKDKVPRTMLQQFEPHIVGSPVTHTSALDDGKQLKMEPWVLDAESIPGREESLNILTPAAEPTTDSKDGVRMGAVQPVIAEGKVDLPRASVVGKVKKEEIRKRRLEDFVGLAGGPNKTRDIKKKRKKRVPCVESGVVPGDHLKAKGAAMFADPYVKSAGSSFLMANEPQRSREGPLKLAEVDSTLQNVDLCRVVHDIQELAVNHSFGAERYADAIALQVVCKYRSLVYQKGLVLPPAGEPDAPESRPVPGKELAAARTMQDSEARKDGSSVALARIRKKAILKPNDPTKTGLKRSPSERQEEISAKRVKKLNKLSSLSGEKKATIGLKAAVASEGLQRTQKDKELSSAATTTLKGKPAISGAVEGKPTIIKQQEQPPLIPKTPSPTALVMKFPARSTLPSVTSLKARFARFGPLDQSAIRVFWKSYTCKVVFKFKPDAETALNYVNSNDVFGQIKVAYYLREVEAPGSDLPTSCAEVKQLPELHFSIEALHGGATISSCPPKRRLLTQPPNGQLKSILKKSGEDGGQSSNGISVREISRGVRFMLGGEDETKVSVKTNSNGNGDNAPSSYTPSSEPPFLSRNQRSIGLPLPPAPTANLSPMLHSQNLVPPSFLGPAPSVLLPLRPRPRPLPPPQLVPEVQLPLPPPCTVDALHILYSEPLSQQRTQHNQATGIRKNTTLDISEQLVGLLIRCRDVVNNVRDAFGYLPYHPI